MEISILLRISKKKLKSYLIYKYFVFMHEGPQVIKQLIFHVATNPTPISLL